MPATIAAASPIAQRRRQSAANRDAPIDVAISMPREIEWVLPDISQAVESFPGRSVNSAL
jgi:hypothetical protein